MKRLLVLALFFQIFTIQHLHANGIGFSPDISFIPNIRLDHNYEEFLSSSATSYDETARGTLTTLGICFTFDTTDSRQSVFNYRLNVCYYYTTVSLESDNLGTTVFRGGGMRYDNTFGLGILRFDSFRMWIGPQVSIGYSWLNRHSGDGNISTLNLLTIGIGAILGFDIGLSEFVTLSITGGARYSEIRGSDALFFSGHKFEGRGAQYVGNIALIFLFHSNGTEDEDKNI